MKMIKLLCSSLFFISGCKNSGSSSAESIQAKINGQNYSMSLTIDLETDSSCVFLEPSNSYTSVTQENIMSFKPNLEIVNKKAIPTDELEKILKTSGNEASLPEFIAPSDKQVSAKYFLKVKQSIEDFTNTAGKSCEGFKSLSLEEELDIEEKERETGEKFFFENSEKLDELNFQGSSPKTYVTKYNTDVGLYLSADGRAWEKKCYKLTGKCYTQQKNRSYYDAIVKKAATDPLAKCKLNGGGSACKSKVSLQKKAGTDPLAKCKLNGGGSACENKVALEQKAASNAIAKCELNGGGSACRRNISNAKPASVFTKEFWTRPSSHAGGR
jgi:hypothetical protein